MLAIKSHTLNILNPNTGKLEPTPTLMGESAYQIAVRNGYMGSESKWIEEITGMIEGSYQTGCKITYDENTKTISIRDRKGVNS